MIKMSSRAIKHFSLFKVDKQLLIVVNCCSERNFERVFKAPLENLAVRDRLESKISNFKILALFQYR